MIIGINESKTVKEHISCERKCKFDGTKCTSNNGGITENVDVSVKDFMYLKKFAKMANI